MAITLKKQEQIGQLLSPTPQRGISLNTVKAGPAPDTRSGLSKFWDQINMGDNNRSWKNPTPNSQRSIFAQTFHNGVMNKTGDYIIKPVLNTVNSVITDPIREVTAQLTNNRAALQAQQIRTAQDIKGSIPYGLGNLGWNTAASFGDLGFKAPILDIMGKSKQADQARTAGLKHFNETPFGQATSAIQFGIANSVHAPNSSLSEVGLDPNATGTQKWVGNPIEGSLNSYFLLKGGETAIEKGGAKMANKVAAKEAEAARVVTEQNRVKIPVTDKSIPQDIPVANLEQQLGDIRLQLSSMASPENINVAKYKQRAAYTSLIQDIQKSDRTPQEKQTLTNRITERYKANQVSLDKILKVRTELDNQASAIKNHPAYQLAHPNDGPIVNTRAVDNTLVQPGQMADSVRGIHGVRGDDELPYKGNKVGDKPKAPDTLQLLNIKISRVKDETRKAELIAERDQRFPNRAQYTPEGKPIVEAKSAPNAFTRAWTSASGVISKFGEGGKELATRIKRWRDTNEVSQEAFVEQIPKVINLNKNDMTTFAKALDLLSKGKNIHVPDHIGEAILEWQKAIPQIRDRAMKAGLDVGDLGPNYFPRFYKNLESITGRKQVAQKMFEQGLAKSPADAMSKLNLMRRDYNQTFGNLEKNRVGNLGGYEMTHKAVLDYIARSFNRITKAEQFGGKNEALNQIMARIEQDGFDVGDKTVFSRTLKTALGENDYSTSSHVASRMVRKVNAVRSLQTSAITNATQLTNTVVMAGFGRTVKGIIKALASKDARAGARQAGVLLDHTINDLAQGGLGVGGKITSNIASPFFHMVEKFNRTASAIVGKDWGNTLAKRAANGSKSAERVLREKLGVTGEIGVKLTREQEIQASRALVEKAQFKVDPQDLPAWVDTSVGKIVAQFRTFGYKQTGFVYNQVLREAVKGNFMPLTRYILTGVPVSVAAGTLKAAIKGSRLPYNKEDVKDKKSIALAAGNAMMDIGGVGLPGSEAKTFLRSANYDGGALAATAGTVFGPTGSFVAETAVNIDKARQGNTKPLIKEGIRNVPVVGQLSANRIIKSNSTAATDKYYAALDNSNKELKGDKKAAADFNGYITRSKNPENGKTIQLSPSESLNNSRMLFSNDKVRKAVVDLEKNGGDHAPSWNLPDDQLKAYMQYKSQYTGDAAKSKLFDDFEAKYGDGSLKAIQDADSKFFDSLPKGKGSEPNKQTPKYPTFDKATETIMATYNDASTEDRGKMMDQLGGTITGYFDKVAEWTNAMRRAEGAPEKNDYPVQSPEVKNIMKAYYALPTKDGVKGGNASRYAWIKANPEAYAKMQDYMSQTTLYNLISEASKTQFKGTTPSQKLLKSIKSMGTYDIATYTDKDGNTVYGINPADAYLQSKSGSGSGYGSGSSKDYFANTEKFRVSAPKNSFRRTKPTISIKAITPKKAKVGGKTTPVNKKVSLKKSLV